MNPKIKIKQVKTLPDIFKQVSYPEAAKALGMNPATLRRYVKVTPEKFRLEDVYRMAEYLEVDGWWMLELVHGWVGERVD
jgi:hypothetical protein